MPNSRNVEIFEVLFILSILYMCVLMQQGCVICVVCYFTNKCIKVKLIRVYMDLFDENVSLTHY